MTLNILNDKTAIYPVYLLLTNDNKLEKLTNSISQYFKRKLLIENNIYLMNDNYEHEKRNIFFHNNHKKYKTIYKKFTINSIQNSKHYYIPLLEYSKFFLNYKIKMCTLIVETLGVLCIQYNYNEFTQKQLNITNTLGTHNTTADIKINTDTQEKLNNAEGKKYEKGLCNYLFLPVLEYEKKILQLYDTFLDKQYFEYDFELKNLIHSRLIGNLFEYDISYETTFIDNKEMEFALGFASQKNIGFNLKKMVNKKLSVTLKINFYKYSELINSDNMQLNDKCLQIIKANNSPPLLINFIETHIEKMCDSNFSVYHFIKIANPKLFMDLITNVNTMKDLDEKNGAYFTKLKSTLYSSLLTFDDDGLSKLQDIYIMKLRKNREIEDENNNISCYDIRCRKENCSCKMYKPLRSIYCYIIRAYNHANPDKIITYGFHNNKLFSITIHYIIMNLKHFTNYDMFTNYITKIINNVLIQIDNQLNETSTSINPNNETNSNEHSILNEKKNEYAGNDSQIVIKNDELVINSADDTTVDEDISDDHIYSI